MYFCTLVKLDISGLFNESVCENDQVTKRFYLTAV